MADHDNKQVNPPEPKQGPLPLDEELYTIADDQALEFMKSQTGIQDPGELKKHILAVQAEAYAVELTSIRFGTDAKLNKYPDCLINRSIRTRAFDASLSSCMQPSLQKQRRSAHRTSPSFFRLKLSRLPAYQRLLAIGKERKGAILLDIGCCFGNDIRKAVADGFPIEGAIGSDLHPEFWELGHKLFRSTPETFPVPFVPGDAFDPAHLEAVPPFYAPPDTPVPQLSTLKSLNPLRGHVSVIHASSFFHLFDEEKQFKLAQSVAGLLSPEPGSMLIGSHGGRPVKGFRVEAARTNSHGITMFCHSPESWTELWDGQIFKKGTVKVEAYLHEYKRRDLEPKVPTPETRFWLLVWSVTRL